MEPRPFGEEEPMEVVVMPAAEEFPVYAEKLEITTQDENLYAGQQLTLLKSLQKQISEHHDANIKTANESHKLALEARDTLLKPLKEAEKIIKAAIAGFGAAAQAKGISTTSKWKAVIEDADSLPEEYMMKVPNQKMLDALAESTRPEIAGVAYKETVTVRAKTA